MQRLLYTLFVCEGACGKIVSEALLFMEGRLKTPVLPTVAVFYVISLLTYTCVGFG